MIPRSVFTARRRRAVVGLLWLASAGLAGVVPASPSAAMPGCGHACCFLGEACRCELEAGGGQAHGGGHGHGAGHHHPESAPASALRVAAPDRCAVEDCALPGAGRPVDGATRGQSTAPAAPSFHHGASARRAPARPIRCNPARGPRAPPPSFSA